MRDVNRHARALIDAYLDHRDPSTRVLLVTVFGDSIAGHGHDVWLGSLAQLVEPLGISNRLVRTSLGRLVRDNLLMNRRHGRRSFYRIHPDAAATFVRADRRIYASTGTEWTKAWTLVVIDPGTGADTRRAIRRELRWAGFGSLAPNVMASPSLGGDVVAAALKPSGYLSEVLITTSQIMGTGGLDDLALATRVAPLQRLGKAYADLVERYGPLGSAVAASPLVDPEYAFILRTLLISDYRRIVLDDPALPAALLPEQWVGNAARQLVGVLYGALRNASDLHLSRVCETSTGGFVLNPAAHRNRFTTKASVPATATGLTPNRTAP